jgi:hypothetical protein
MDRSRAGTRKSLFHHRDCCSFAHYGFPFWADSEREAATSETQADFWRTAQSIRPPV